MMDKTPRWALPMLFAGQAQGVAQARVDGDLDRFQVLGGGARGAPRHPSYRCAGA